MFLHRLYYLRPNFLTIYNRYIRTKTREQLLVIGGGGDILVGKLMMRLVFGSRAKQRGIVVLQRYLFFISPLSVLFVRSAKFIVVPA